MKTVGGRWPILNLGSKLEVEPWNLIWVGAGPAVLRQN